MERRRLGNSDLLITPIGFGAWAIGGTGYQYAWGPQDDNDSIASILRALELGINWIDTAPGYGKGHSEKIVARALAGWSGEPPFIFTKCGFRWDAAGEIYQLLKAESILQECEESLQRLNLETIDLFQIHWPSDKMAEVEEAVAACARLQREGKIRWFGVSNFSVEQMQRAREICPISSLQPPYSLIKREIETEILPYCEREGIGVIVYSPMYSGLLTGAMTRERAANLPANDWRRRDPEFNEPNLTKNLGLVERLGAIGARHGRTPGEVAIAWTLRNPVVTGAIVGARNARQVEGTIGAAEFRLSEAQAAEIELFLTHGS